MVSVSNARSGKCKLLSVFGGEQSARCEVGLPVLEPTACRKYLILAEMSKPAHAAGFGVTEADSQILEQIRLVDCLVRIW